MKKMIATILMSSAVGLLTAPVVANGNDAETIGKVPIVTLKGQITEVKDPFSIFGSVAQTTLRDLTARIRTAAEDEEVLGLVVRLEQPMFSMSQGLAIHDALLDFSMSGKPLWVSSDVYSIGTYLLASTATEIVLPEPGGIMTIGLPVSMYYFADTLDKLGMEAQVVNTGRFKNAMEPFTHREMSDGTREQMGALIDDLYGFIVNQIASNRGIEASLVEKLLTEGPFTAEQSIKNGFVDRVAYQEDMKEIIKDYLGGEVDFPTSYGRRTSTRQTPSFFEMMMGRSSRTATRTDESPKIGLIYAFGPIIDGHTTSSPFGSSQMIASESFISQLNEVVKEPGIKAIVIRVDSPGGSAIASDRIWNRLNQIQADGINVIVSMGDVAASGGYYISMGAERIFAEPTTITGSIGVVGGKIVMGGLYDSIGVRKDSSLSIGPHTGLMDETSPWGEKEQEILNALLDDIYDQFTAKAALGRGVSQDRIKELGGGRVWSGISAKENGLIDELGTLDDAIAYARQVSGYDDAELAIFPKEKTFFEVLEELMGGNVSTTMTLPISLNPQFAGTYALLETVIPSQHLRTFFTMVDIMKNSDTPTMMVMPYALEIKW